MLYPCPECGQHVSDKAQTCPSCGYPLTTFSRKSPPRKNTPKRRRRLPNGFGQITELKGRNLKNPFRVMITVDKDDDGRPVAALLQPKAYFPTYNDAYTALLEYHKDPFDLTQIVTLEHLYKEWCKYRQGKELYKTAWNYCDGIKKRDIRSLKPSDIGKIIDSNTEALGVNQKIKTLLSQMFDYAIAHSLVTTNCARNYKLEIPKYEETHHISFTDKEMTTLWKHHVGRPTIEMILVSCYMGWRPNELLNITLDSIDWENRTIVGGSKTEAGKNRIVPIHSAVLDLVKSHAAYAKEKGSPYLYPSVTKPSCRMSYDFYHRHFVEVLAELGLSESHRPHDCRKQFVTMAKKYKVDDFAIKRIVGHVLGDLTEEIYTDRPIDWLHEEVEKIIRPAF